MACRFMYICCLLWLPVAASADTTITINLCQSDEGDYPWTLPDRPGLNNLLIDRAAHRTGVTVRFHPMPWSRCLLKTSQGSMDGIVAASYRAERLRIGAYPLRDGLPDAERRLMRNRYLLFRRKDDTGVQWDGRRLQIDGIVGVQTGYSITSTLKQHGAMISQRERLPIPLLDALVDGSLRAITLTAGEGERLLTDIPAYGRTVEAMPIPLAEKDFYLVFSHRFQQKYPALTERLWLAVSKEQKSADWQAVSTNFR